jgi:hypothetical protein
MIEVAREMSFCAQPFFASGSGLERDDLLKTRIDLPDETLLSTRVRLFSSDETPASAFSPLRTLATGQGPLWPVG